MRELLYKIEWPSIRRLRIGILCTYWHFVRALPYPVIESTRSPWDSRSRVDIPCCSPGPFYILHITVCALRVCIVFIQRLAFKNGDTIFGCRHLKIHFGHRHSPTLRKYRFCEQRSISTIVAVDSNNLLAVMRQVLGNIQNQNHILWEQISSLSDFGIRTERFYSMDYVITPKMRIKVEAVMGVALVEMSGKEQVQFLYSAKEYEREIQ